ncbi:uvrB/uvrC motif-containing protein [Wolffia australiana]
MVRADMMQGTSASGFAASANGSRSCGSVALWKEESRVRGGILWTGGISPWREKQLSRSFSAIVRGSRRRSSAVKASWLFNQRRGGMDASSERSENANEDILLFFFQLDLQTRIQYALNTEQYEVAQQLRNKLAEVEGEIISKREASRGSSAKNEAQDKAINLLCLRADLQKAIERENYTLAADLRDEISKIEAESLAASAKALAYENLEYSFRLGQKLKHKIFGYQAVVCGMDPVCCETNSWMEAAQVERLNRGPNQPFYQVLVNVNEEPELLVAYVAEENLLAEEPLPAKARPMLGGGFDHPYVSFLFYGVDSAGDFIPVKQLRDKYKRPRHEVPADGQEDET